MLTSVREHTSPHEEDLRIRLEGAYEILERARDRYAHAESLIGTTRFRTALLQEPQLFDELLQKEPGVQQAREKAEAFNQRSPSDELTELLGDFAKRRANLHQLATKRLRSKGPLSFEDALKNLRQRVFAEIPGDLQPGEKRMSELRTGMHPALAVCIALWISLYLAGPAIIALPSLPPVLVGVGQSVVLMLLAGFWANSRSGTFTLTSRRMIWRPRLGEPVQVDLKTLKSGDVEQRFGSLRVNALVPFKVRGVGRPQALAAQIEALRFVLGQPHHPDSEVDAAIFPADAGEMQFFGDEINPNAGVAMMRPAYAVFLLANRSDRIMRELTGYTGRARMDLTAALQLLRQLPEEKFDERIRAAAEKHGVLLDRAKGAHIGSNGPVWQHLVVTDGRNAFNTRITWRHLEQVELMVAKWRKWER